MAAGDEHLLRLRLAAQRLSVPAADVVAAARAVLGVQAQDVRAAALALRSRVPGLERQAVVDAPLVRTWTVRGTVHLVACDDLPWLTALTGERNRRRFDALMAKRGNLEPAEALLGDLVALLEERPRDRAELLRELAARGHPDLGPYSVNVLMPWVAARGLAVGLPDGRFTAAEPPPPVDADEALATLGARYLAGYGPATADDLARWSGLPVTAARRALAAVTTEARGELLALPGTWDDEPPEPPPAQLLAAFDTVLLGHRSREPVVRAADDARILPGGGMLRPVVLVGGRAAGTWRVTGSGARRTLDIAWFRRAARSRALRAEAEDVGRFLGWELAAVNGAGSRP
ncbi:MAG TPA: winged helix DNA-binding domain-containing protein [Baekduia sp.]|nr:winged helix DNA-binding domain-containing protein [Baekduia sp.]